MVELDEAGRRLDSTPRLRVLFQSYYGDYAMKHLAKAQSVKAVNYTPEQEAAIRAASPLDIDKAKALAADIGKSWRSVIAKAKSMDLPYQAKPAPAKRPKGLTKAELVSQIETATGADLNGLEKATGQALARLLESL